MGEDVDDGGVRQRLAYHVRDLVRGGGFGGVGEAVQLAEPDRAVAGLDVAEHAAGADRGELLIITDEPNTATAAR